MYPEPSTAQKFMAEATKGTTNRLKAIRKEERALGVNTPGFTEYFAFGGGRQVSSGVRVTQETAMRTVAVYACVTYISDYVASLPKIIYKWLKPKGKDRATDFYLYSILHDQPNPFQNDYEFVETLTGHVLLWGNAYAEVERDGGGRVMALWPLRPDRMRIVLTGNQVVYLYTRPDGGEQPLREVLHLRGLGNDGIVGYSPISLAREAVGLAIAEEEYRARFLGNNASPGGALVHPGTLTKAAQDNLRRQWEETHGGLSNSHRVAVLEEGIKWQQIGIPAKDMEFIEGRKFQKTEIATLFRVKPHKLNILEPGTVSYASIEQQSLDNHIDTMRPWIIRWEKKFTALLSAAEKVNYFVEFNMDAVLRGDSKSRAEVLQIWRANGIISANDWLDIESRNPISADKGGDDYWRPANMAVIGEEPVQGDLFAQPLNGQANGNGKANHM